MDRFIINIINKFVIIIQLDINIYRQKLVIILFLSF